MDLACERRTISIYCGFRRPIRKWNMKGKGKKRKKKCLQMCGWTNFDNTLIGGLLFTCFLIFVIRNYWGGWMVQPYGTWPRVPSGARDSAKTDNNFKPTTLPDFYSDFWVGSRKRRELMWNLIDTWRAVRSDNLVAVKGLQEQEQWFPRTSGSLSLPSLSHGQLLSL